ncbi:MAG TPA: Ig-like domain-containing protein [Candidatus Nanopelagicales bacterium]|nr:Ig-like domain-containing protein [Candidatus Nanopelagicales bacterium]
MLVRPAAVAAAAALLLSGCAGSGFGFSAGDGASPSESGPYVAPTLTATRPAPFDQPLHVAASKGGISAITVTEVESKDQLTGVTGAGGKEWVSDEPPKPGAKYAVSATVVDGDHTSQVRLAVLVSAVPAAQKMSFGMLPGSNRTVGVNAPVVIRFEHKVTKKADVENALTVSSTTPVEGSWHWVSSSELHFRPKNPWPAHTQVRVEALFDGLQMSDTRWGTRDVTASFQTGDAHEVFVDDKTKTFTLKVNGKVKYVWPTSLGRPEYETRTGNYIVLERDPLREMTSCAAKITCDKASKDYYDLQVQWATRLSWSGTFIHAAPWSVAKQGLVDSSHGCIHLTIDRAKTYFDQALYGDIVHVLRTSRPIDDLVAKGDPGASDWNLTWEQYVNASALGHSITTQLLTDPVAMPTANPTPSVTATPSYSPSA